MEKIPTVLNTTNHSLQVLAFGNLSKDFCRHPEIQDEYAFRFAESEPEALEWARNFHFHFILLSYPESAGDDFRILKKIKNIKDIPCIVIADGELSSDRMLATYEAGASDIILKNAPVKISRAKIRAILNLRAGTGSHQEVLETKQEQLEFALSSAKMGTWTVELPSGYTDLSEEARELFGFAKTYDHSDAAIDEFIHPDFREHARLVLANAIATNSFYNDEYQIVRPDGEIRWINARGRTQLDSSGRPFRLSGLIWDITDRKNAEISLKALEMRFLRSAQATDLGVWYCNLPLDVLIWNNEVKRHFFLPPEARVTIDLFYEIIHPDDREKAREAVNNSILSRKPYDIIYRTVNPKNREDINFIRAIGWTDYNEAGKPIRFDGITLDVSLQHAYEEELRAAKNAAEKANELKSAFLANMSHEIRTPLGAMIGFSDLLKDPTLSHEDRLSYANVITRNGHQLSHIINDILDISKVESGQFTVENIEVDPKAIAEEVVGLLSLNAKEKGVTLSFRVMDNAPKTIYTDPLRLRQILMNIVGNAVKFTHRGEVTLTLFSSVKNAIHPEVSYRVEDTGEGIARADQKKLFQLFSQADDSITRKFGGTGLGLALSKKLANALQGDVILERSEKAKGSSFLITVTSGDPFFATKDKAPEKREDLPLPNLEGVKVLLIDDTPDNQELIAKVLSEYGVIVDIANDGLLGVTKALGGRHDLVLMDLQMPVMDGYTATQKLRERGFAKPIVALSAHAMSEARVESLNVGCTDYLTKPINFNELLQVVAKYKTSPLSRGFWSGCEPQKQSSQQGGKKRSK